MKRILTIALLAVLGVLLFAGDVAATSHPECVWVGVPPVLVCRGTDPGGGGGPGGPSTGIIWVTEDQGYQEACPDGTNLWWEWQVDLATGETPFNSSRTDLDWNEFCAPPAGPPPPTLAEFSAELDRLVPRPVLVTNPDGVGVSGLETWFWYDTAMQPTTLSGILDVRSFQIQYQLDAVEWAWSTGDGAVLRSDVPGSDSSLPGTAAVTHTYETKAYYDIELCVTWSGTWSVVGEPSSPIPARDFCSTTEYRVDEIVTRVSG